MNDDDDDLYVCLSHNLYLFIVHTTATVAVTYILKNQFLNKFLSVVETYDHEGKHYILTLTNQLSTDAQWKFLPSLYYPGYYFIQHITTGLCLDVSIHDYNIIHLTPSSSSIFSLPSSPLSPATLSSPLSQVSLSSPSSASLVSPSTPSASSLEKDTQLWQPIYCDNSRISFKLINKHLQFVTNRRNYLTSSTPSTHHRHDEYDDNINDAVIYSSSNDSSHLSIWCFQDYTAANATPRSALFSSNGK